MEISIIVLFDAIGVFVCAISGMLLAVDKKLDFIGVFIIAFVTALGGGTLRDILIGSTPVGWMQNKMYIYIVGLTLPIGYFFTPQLRKMRTSIFLFDAIGLGIFGVSGFEKSRSYGLSLIVSIMMGVVSAVFGGVIRDILCNRIPMVMIQKELYATTVFIGICSYILSKNLGVPIGWDTLISVICVVTIRYVTVKYRWGLDFKPIQNKKPSKRK